MIIVVELLPFKNPGCVVGLSLITIKSAFYTSENKINCQGKMSFCEGNVREF